MYIDSTQGEQERQQATGHELAHIFLDHFSQPEKPMLEKEREAGEKALHFYREYLAGNLSN